MKQETYVFEPRVYPRIKSGDTDYVVDLKRGHFRRVSSPFEVIEFESEPGQMMCATVGVITCSICKTSVMHHGVLLGLVNLATKVTLLRALAALPGPAVFPSVTAGTIVLTVLSAMVLWRERYARRALIGMGLAVLGLVLIHAGGSGG